MHTSLNIKTWINILLISEKITVIS